MRKAIQTIVVFPIKVYQKLISPLLPSSCRFEPTCSQYMLEAIYEWGVVRGILLGSKRIFRCNPWGGFGQDNVPTNPKNKQL